MTQTDPDPDRDERGAKPSASKRQRTKECPASFKECQKVEGLLTSTAEQKTGTLYHSGFEGDPLALQQLAFNKDFQKLNAYFKYQERRIIHRIFRSSPIDISREKRVWLYDADGEPIFSGRRDLKVSGIINGAKTALILEYKTGWKPQPAADRNLQVRGNAALAQYEEANETGVPYIRIYGALLERPLFGKQVALHEMGEQVLEQELEDIEQESAIALGENPEYRIGSHCEGCSAIGICPAIAQKRESAEQKATELKLDNKKALKERTLNAAGREKLRSFIKEGQLVAKAHANAKDLAKALLTADPQAFGAVSDIYLRPGNEVRVVEDVYAVYATLKKLASRRGLPIESDDFIETFLSLTDLTVTNLNQLVGQVLQVQESAEVEKLIEKSFKKAVQIRTNDPSLKIAS